MLPQAPLIKPGGGGGSTPAGTTVAAITANQSGSLLQGSTIYLGHENAFSSEFPLYVAQGNETVKTLNMVSLTGNGAAHTDTYKVVKNGVVTTMTLAITNASSGSTSSNQVSLVAGDRVAIQVVTGAATAAADVLAQLTIVTA